MPFSFGESINSISSAMLKSPTIVRIASNPILSAAFLAVCCMIIVMFVFRSADTDESIYIMGLRASFWTFLCGIMVIFTNNKVLGCGESKVGSYDAELFEPAFDNGVDQAVVTIDKFDINDVMV